MDIVKTEDQLVCVADEPVGATLPPYGHESAHNKMYPYSVAVKKEPLVGTNDISPVSTLERNFLTPTVKLVRLEYSLDPTIKKYMAKMWISANPVKLESVDLGTLSYETIGSISAGSNDESVVGHESAYNKMYPYPVAVKKEPSVGTNDISPVSTLERNFLTPTVKLANPVKLESVNLGTLSYETIGSISAGSNDESVVGHKSAHNKMYPYSVAVKKEPSVGTNDISPVSMLDTNFLTPTVKLVRLEHSLDPAIKKHLAQMWILANPVEIESVDLGTLSYETIGISAELNDESVVAFPRNIKIEQGEEINDATTSQKSQSTSNSCVRCQKSFALAIELTRHECVNVTIMSFQCDICQLRFSRKPHLVRHMNTHRRKKQHQYDTCQKTFMHKSSLRVHMGTHTREKRHKCNTCQKSFSLESSLKTHMFLHTVEKQHRCDICEKSFSQKGGLTRHMLIHTSEKQHRCDTCQKSFSQKSGLTSHMLIHTGEKQHHCDICQRSFGRKHSLKVHMGTHTRDRRNECNSCQTSYNNKISLKRHMLIHTVEQLHKCNICQKSFSHKRYLKKHMLIHTGEKLHKCNICQKSFRLKSYLMSHMVVHGEKKHKCETCQKSYFHKRHLKSHMHTHTGEKPY